MSDQYHLDISDPAREELLDVFLESLSTPGDYDNYNNNNNHQGDHDETYIYENKHSKHSSSYTSTSSYPISHTHPVVNNNPNNPDNPSDTLSDNPNNPNNPSNSSNMILTNKKYNHILTTPDYTEFTLILSQSTPGVDKDSTHDQCPQKDRNPQPTFRLYASRDNVNLNMNNHIHSSGSSGAVASLNSSSRVSHTNNSNSFSNIKSQGEVYNSRSSRAHFTPGSGNTGRQRHGHVGFRMATTLLDE